MKEKNYTLKYDVEDWNNLFNSAQYHSNICVNETWKDALNELSKAAKKLEELVKKSTNYIDSEIKQIVENYIINDETKEMIFSCNNEVFTIKAVWYSEFNGYLVFLSEPVFVEREGFKIFLNFKPISSEEEVKIFIIKYFGIIKEMMKAYARTFFATRNLYLAQGYEYDETDEQKKVIEGLRQLIGDEIYEQS